MDVFSGVKGLILNIPQPACLERLNTCKYSENTFDIMQNTIF